MKCSGCYGTGEQKTYFVRKNSRSRSNTAVCSQCHGTGENSPNPMRPKNKVKRKRR